MSRIRFRCCTNGIRLILPWIFHHGGGGGGGRWRIIQCSLGHCRFMMINHCGWGGGVRTNRCFFFWIDFLFLVLWWFLCICILHGRRRRIGNDGGGDVFGWMIRGCFVVWRDGRRRRRRQCGSSRIDNRLGRGCMQRGGGVDGIIRCHHRHHHHLDLIVVVRNGGGGGLHDSYSYYEYCFYYNMKTTEYKIEYIPVSISIYMYNIYEAMPPTNPVCAARSYQGSYRTPRCVWYVALEFDARNSYRY